ncbi:MAG: pyridoxal-dependent decarboxylase, exosortase A system-associated [Chromatiales bacterium]|nr:pyridoxal-dependent decarboxylase, exosortase A system-associated [Chromatiales bacterium]
MATLPLHVALTGYSASPQGELLVAGQPLGALAAEAGRTPFYAYSRALVDARIASLRAALAGQVDLHYAVKANPYPPLLAHLAAQVDGLDVASGGELQLALATGLPATRISFAGPGKTDAELAAAIAAGITINCESAGELQRLAAAADSLGRPARVALRVNPDFELRGAGMKMGGGARPFGIDAEQVPALLAGLASLPVEFTGFHIFCGSQNLHAGRLVESQARSLELALRLATHAPVPPTLINIGGGFGIPYFPGDKPLALEPVADSLCTLAATLAGKLPSARLAIELGRYLVGEAGLYVCRVIDRKVSRGRVFLVTDGGLHHHLAASGNFGQVLRRNYPVLIGNRVGQQPEEETTVVGPLCTPLDLLADRMMLPRAEPGDLVVVFQSGAYGFSASPLRFLGHPEPVELLV